MQKQHNGFTLIELVIVIIVLGILSATAIPKFLNLRDAAEISRVKALGAAYQQAVDNVHIRWNTLGLTRRQIDMPGFADGTVDVNDNGFPLGTTKGIGGSMTDPHNIGKRNEACIDLWVILLEIPPTVSLTKDGSDFQAYKMTDDNGYKSQCHYIFRVLGDEAEKIADAKVSIKYDSVIGKVTTTIQ